MRQELSDEATTRNELRIAAVHHRLGLLRSNEIPTLATSALQSGIDSTSLRVLAGEPNPTWENCCELLDRALRELGIPNDPKPDKGMPLALYYATHIVSGALTPHEGARRIWLEVFNEGTNDEKICSELGPFVALASDYPKSSSERDEFDHEIRREAEQLIKRHK
jgi:hypothetical protein